MRPSLQRFVSRLAAVGLLAAVLTSFAAFVVMPVVSHLDRVKTQIEQERTLLGRLQTLNDDAAAAEALGRMTARAKGEQLFVDGESDGIRLANLQSLVGGITSSQGVKVRSSRNLPAKERSEVRFIGVQLLFGATIDQLQKIMTAIEAQRPYLFIDALHITPVPGALAAGGDETGQLEIRMEILGATQRQKS